MGVGGMERAVSVGRRRCGVRAGGVLWVERGEPVGCGDRERAVCGGMRTCGMRGEREGCEWRDAYLCDAGRERGLRVVRLLICVGGA